MIQSIEEQAQTLRMGQRLSGIRGKLPSAMWLDNSPDRTPATPHDKDSTVYAKHDLIFNKPLESHFGSE